MIEFTGHGHRVNNDNDATQATAQPLTLQSNESDNDARPCAFYFLLPEREQTMTIHNELPDYDCPVQMTYHTVAYNFVSNRPDLYVLNVVALDQAFEEVGKLFEFTTADTTCFLQYIYEELDMSMLSEPPQLDAMQFANAFVDFLIADNYFETM